MSIDPNDYDHDELLRMARKQGRKSGGGDVEDPVEETNIGPEPAASTGTDTGTPSSFRANLYRELLPLEASSDADKPYLDTLPEHYAGEHLIFEWIEFLLLHAGYQGAIQALDYYESVGWITEDCQSTLNDYLLGLEDEPSNPSDLDIDDHLLSLVYIAKLAAMQ